MNKRFIVRDLVMAAIFTALSIVLTRLLSVQVTNEMRIGIGPLPIILTGVLFGPVLGGLAGLAADMIGVMINLGGAFHFGFTLSSVLTGLIPGIISFFLFRRKEYPKLNTTILLSIICVYGFVHLILNSIWLEGLYGTPVNLLMIGRAPKVMIEAVIVGILLKILFEKVFNSLLVKGKI